jgi:hypothetical protein
VLCAMPSAFGRSGSGMPLTHLELSRVYICLTIR